jgi:hypothetical protein
MRGVLKACRGRGLIVVLATGTTISLTALTGGITPALADPGNGPSITTPVVPPQPPGGGNSARPGRNPDVAAAPQLPRFAPEAPPAVESPPQPQAPVAPQAPVEPAPRRVASPPSEVAAPPSEVAAPPSVVAQPKPTEAPPVAVAPEPVTTTIPAPKPLPRSSSAPQIAASPKPEQPAAGGPAASSAPAAAPSVAPTPQAPPSPRSVPTPAFAPPPSSSPAPGAPPAGVTPSPSPAAGPETVIAQPAPKLAGEPSAPPSPPIPGAGPGAQIGAPPSPDSEPPTLAGKRPGDPASTPGTPSASPGSPKERTLQVHDAAKLQAPEADIALAKESKPIEARPEPAPKAEVDDLSSATHTDHDFGWPGELGRPGGPDWHEPAGTQRNWNQPPRQWDRDWVRYDDHYRPVLFNPYHQTVKIVYVYQNQPRIVWIPPLAQIVLNTLQYAAYSFTALVVDTIGTVVNAAVGTFFGGGYYPAPYYAAPPPPPPPLLAYNQVPVRVNYRDASYEPFLVQRVVDVGNDTAYGEHKVLLDGVTPVWGEWTQTGDGQRQFEVHKTQQFPGLDDPREGPLPGDYQLRLANTSSDEASGFTAKDVWAIAASAVVGALGISWLAAFGMSRRRSRRLL